MAKRMRKTRRKVSIRNKIGATVRGRMLAAKLGPTAGYEGYETVNEMVDVADKPEPKGRARKAAKVTASKAEKLTPTQFAKKWKAERTKAVAGDKQAAENLAQLRKTGIEQGILSPDGKRLNSHSDKKKAARAAKTEAKTRRAHNRATASIDDIHAARADQRPRDYWESVDAETMRKEQNAKEEIDSLRDLDEKGIAELRESTAAQMKEIVNKLNYGTATAADENELDELTHFAYALDAATLRETGFDPFDPDNTPEWTLTENFSALNDQDLQRIENNPFIPGWQRDLASEELEHRQPWRDGGILQSMLKDASITELRATQAMFMGDDAQYTNAELRQLAAKTGNARYAYDGDTFDADYAAWLENVTGEKLDPETFKKLNAIGGKPTPEQQAIIDKLGYIPNRANYARTLRNEPVNTTTGKPRTHRNGQPEPDGYDTNLEALYGKDTIDTTADEINSIQAMETDQVETELTATINDLKAWGHPPQFADVHDEYQFHQALHHAFMLDAEAHARRNQHTDTGEPNPFHDEPPAFGDATADNFDPFDDALLAEKERAHLAEIDTDELETLAADASATGNTQYSDFIWDELQHRNPEIEGGEIDQALPYAGIRELTALYKKWAPDTPIDNAFKERVKEQAARRGNERYRNHPAAQEEYDNWLDTVLNVDDGKGGKINIRDGLYMGDKTDPNGGGLYKDANGNFKPVTLSFEEAITNDMMAVQLGEEISRAIEENIGFLPNQTNFMKMVRGERPKQFRYSPDERRDMATMGGRKSRPKTVKEKLDKENAEARNATDATDKPRKATPDAPETPEATNLKKRLEEATRAENQRHKDNAAARKQQGAAEVQQGEQLKENGEIVRDAAIIYPRDNGTYAVKPYTPTGQGDKRAPNGKGHPAKDIDEARELADTITAMVGMSDTDIRAAIDGDDKRRAEMAIAERDRRAALSKADAKPTDGKATDAKATTGKARADKPATPNKDTAKDTEKARTAAAKRTTAKDATAKPQAKKETTGNKETTAKPAKDNDVMAAMTNENTGRISRKADLTKFTDKQLENTEKALRAENPTDPKQQRDQASALRHIDREKGRRWAAKWDKEKAEREAAKPKAQREREAREREAHENVLVAIAHKNPQGRWVKNHSTDQKKNLQRLDEKTLTDAINHNETGRTAGEVKDAAKKELARRERLRKNADKPAPKRPKGVPEKGIEDATDKELINFLRYAQRLERWMEAHKRAGTDNTDDYVDQLDGRGHDVTEASEIKRELKRRGYALNNLSAGRQDGSNEADMFAERKAEKARQAQRDKQLAKARAATKRAAEHKKKLLNGESLDDITDKELQGYDAQFRGDEPNFNSLKGEARDTARDEYRTLKAAVNAEMIKRGLRQDPNEAFDAEKLVSDFLDAQASGKVDTDTQPTFRDTYDVTPKPGDVKTGDTIETPYGKAQVTKTYPNGVLVRPQWPTDDRTLEDGLIFGYQNLKINHDGRAEDSLTPATFDTSHVIPEKRVKHLPKPSNFRMGARGDYFTTADLEERGWTKKDIQQLLGAPDDRQRISGNFGGLGNGEVAGERRRKGSNVWGREKVKAVEKLNPEKDFGEHRKTPTPQIEGLKIERSEDANSGKPYFNILNAGEATGLNADGINAYMDKDGKLHVTRGRRFVDSENYKDDEARLEALQEALQAIIDGKEPATPAKPAVKPASQAERNKTAKLDAALKAAIRQDTTGNTKKQAHKLVADRLGISGATTQEDFTKRVNEYVDANGELTTLEENALIDYAVKNKLSTRDNNGMPIYLRDNAQRTAEEERRLTRAELGMNAQASKLPTGTRELSVNHRPTKTEIAEAIRTLNAKPETKEVKKPTPTPATPTDGAKPVVNEFTPAKGRDKGKKRLYINNIDEIIRDDSTKRTAPYLQDSNLKAWVDEDGIVHIDDRRTYVADIGGYTHKDLKEQLQALLSDAVGRGLVDRHGNEVTPGKPAVRKVSEGTPLPEGDKSLPATPAPESAPKEQPEAPVTVSPVTPPSNTEDAKKLQSIAVKDGDTARIVRAQTNYKKTQDNPEELKRLLKITHETETKSLENLIALSEYLKTHPEERKTYPFNGMQLVNNAQAAREQLANRQRMEWAAKVDGENIISRPDKPRELKHWPGVNTTSPHDEDLVITHEPGEGTMIHGTNRGDGTAAILKKNGWKWSRNLRAWYIPNSRDNRPNMRKINTTSRDLMAEGHNSIGHDITNELEDALTRRAGKAQRLSDRADALEAKAERMDAKAEQAWQRHNELSRQLPPAGEPIKVDHYSAPRHRRAIEKAWDALGRSVQADKAAQEVHRRAGVARANALNRDKSPEYLRNRIEERKSAMRAAERDLMGTHTNGRPPVTGEAREIALENYFDAIDEIDALRALLQEVDPNALTETLENTDGIGVGDIVKIGKEQGTVLKVTPKTVTIRYRDKWSNTEMERRVNINTITAHIPANEETRKAIQTENTAKATNNEGTSPSITQRILKRHAIEGEKFDRNGIVRNGIKIKSSTRGLGTYMFEGPDGTKIKLVSASAGIADGSPRNLDDARVIADRIAEDLKLNPKFARNQYVGVSDERLEEAYKFGTWGASELYKARREARENNPAKEGDTPKGKAGKQPAKNIIDTGERGAWSRRTGKEQTKQDKEALEYQPTPQQLDPNNPGIYVNKAGYWGTPETISPGTEEPWADEPGGWRPGMVPAAILVQKDGKNYSIDLVKNQGNKFIVTGTEVDTGEKLTMTADLFGNTGETYTLRFDPEYEGIYSTADFPTP